MNLKQYIETYISRELGNYCNATNITEIVSNNATYYDWKITSVKPSHLYCKLTSITVHGKVLLYYIVKDTSSGLKFKSRHMYPWEDGDSEMLKILLQDIKSTLIKH